MCFFAFFSPRRLWGAIRKKRKERWKRHVTARRVENSQKYKRHSRIFWFFSTAMPAKARSEDWESNCRREGQSAHQARVRSSSFMSSAWWKCFAVLKLSQIIGEILFNKSRKAQCITLLSIRYRKMYLTSVGVSDGPNCPCKILNMYTRRWRTPHNTQHKQKYGLTYWICTRGDDELRTTHNTNRSTV